MLTSCGHITRVGRAVLWKKRGTASYPDAPAYDVTCWCLFSSSPKCRNKNTCLCGVWTDKTLCVMCCCPHVHPHPFPCSLLVHRGRKGSQLPGSKGSVCELCSVPQRQKLDGSERPCPCSAAVSAGKQGVGTGGFPAAEYQSCPDSSVL